MSANKKQYGVDRQAYQVHCEPLQDIAALRTQWLDLQRRSRCSFFLSWGWIGCWLQVIKPHCDVISVVCSDQLVGLGLLVRNRQRRHGIISSNTLYLHQTGDPDKDKMWIEYNEFLTDAGHTDAATRSSLEFLLNQHPGWDEFIVGAISSKQQELLTSFGLVPVELWESPAYAVDLARLRHDNSSYLGSLSSNTRYQINRSRRLYETKGQLVLKRAETVAEAHEFLDRIAPLHQARWGAGAGESGFGNPLYVEFHRQLIADNFGTGGVDLWRLALGDETIACLYNFVYKDTVYFYVSGVCYGTDGHLKPGLLCHAMVIERYLQEGKNVYDFMGGDSQYKQSLASYTDTLTVTSLQRSSWQLQLERCGRYCKNRLIGRVRKNQ